MSETRTINLATFIVSCAAATLGMMISLAFFVFHLYHRNNKVVKMSSPIMNLITSVGAIFLNVVCFLYGMEYIVDESMSSLSILCQIRIWLFVFAITLLFSPVAAKTWRVHKIFKYGFAKKVVIRDIRLLFIIMCMLIVDCTLLTLWQTIDPSTAHRLVYVIQDLGTQGDLLTNTSYTIDECTCSNFGVWVGVLGIWKTVMFAVCLYFAWKVKNVAVPGLNDSSATLTSICLSVAIMFCATISTSTLQGNKNSVYIVNTLAIVMSGSLTQLILFLPKQNESICLSVAIMFCATISTSTLQGNKNSVYIVNTLAIVLSGSLTQLILFLPKVTYWWRTPENVSPRISTASLKPVNTRVPDQLADDVIPGDVNGNWFPDEGLQDIVDENKQLKDSLIEKEQLISTMQDHLDLAKQKLSMLPSGLDPRQKGGVENCGRSYSTDDIYDTLRPEPVPDRSDMYRIERSSNDIDDGSDPTRQTAEDQTQTEIRARLTRSHSILSTSSERSFVAEFTDIRNSIAAELDNASIIHEDLRRSVSRDLERPYSATEWLYESRQSQELAGSIAQSYNLGDNTETFSYINNYLPRENTVFQIRSTRRTSAGSSVVSFHSSAENVSCTDAETMSSNNDIQGTARDSETPNSQQHAAILRYYSYRHINDGFQRFQSSKRYNKNMKPSSFKKKSRQHSVKKTENPKTKAVIELHDPSAIYSAPKKRPRVWTKWSTPRDSFV